MKYKYIIIDSVSTPHGSNEITDKMSDEFECGRIQIVDCEHGDALENIHSKEWYDLEEYE